MDQTRRLAALSIAMLPFLVHAGEKALFVNSSDPTINTDEILSALTIGQTVRLPEGVIPIDNIVFPLDYGRIIGAGMPIYNGSDLVGGTVLIGGTLNMNNKKGVLVKDLGVQVEDKDSIRSGLTSAFYEDGLTEDMRCQVENVATMCMGVASHHGLVFTSGNRNTVINFKSYNQAHGLVFRSSDNTALGVWVENPLNTILTIKALLDTGQDATGNFAQISGIGGNITLDARDGFSVTENTVDAIVRNTNYLPGGGLLERYETKGEGNFGFIYSNDIRIRLVGRNRAPPIDADQI